VQFTYQGKKHFKTNYGAFISILIKGIMIAFIVFEAVVVFTRKHPRVSVKEVLNDMDDSHGGMAPFHYGFDLAVGLLSRT
jgi:large-conductance mechanosensitive channel